ncbi:MAG: hypothetical protein H7Z72_18190 [Bacteroidetes bacterium]|nr:hypothetical protein [Fibrella sp.]
MKKFILSVLVLATFSATAQEFKPFKFNISTGYAKPTGPGASGGFLLSLEPKYGLSDRVDLGLRLEVAAMARAYRIDGDDAEGEVKGAGSYLLTGNYLLSDGNFRPFVGAGVGLFSVGSSGFTVTNGMGVTDGDVAGGNKFGGMVRAGFKAGHFVLGLEYNLVPRTTGFISSVPGTNINYESDNSYFGIKVGVDIGGGRK